MSSAAAHSFVQASENRNTSSQCASKARSYSRSADSATIELALIPTYTEQRAVSHGRDCRFSQGDPPSTGAGAHAGTAPPTPRRLSPPGPPTPRSRGQPAWDAGPTRTGTVAVIYAWYTYLSLIHISEPTRPY